MSADPRVYPSACNDFSVRLACQKGRGSVVKLLPAEPRVNPAAEESAPFKVACKNGCACVVIVLLEDPRVNPDASEGEAMLWTNPRPRFCGKALAS
jgi:hypothetical protein